MDTDDLTPMAYETLSLAHDVFEMMRPQIGMAASEHRTEDEFLRGIAAFLDEILNEPEDYLGSWDWLQEVDRDKFIQGVRRIRSHVDLTLNTPLAHRGKPPFQL